MRDESTKVLNRVQLIRKTKGYTQEYVANRMKITQGNYNHIENAEQKYVKLDMLFELSDILETDICVLLGCKTENVAREEKAVYEVKSKEIEGLKTEKYRLETEVKYLSNLVEAKNEIISLLRKN